MTDGDAMKDVPAPGEMVKDAHYGCQVMLMYSLGFAGDADGASITQRVKDNMEAVIRAIKGNRRLDTPITLGEMKAMWTASLRRCLLILGETELLPGEQPL